MDYGSVIKEALSTFWKHKSLWVFGIIIALFGQGDYGFSVNYRESVSYSPEQGIPPGFADFPGRDLMIEFFDNPVPYLVGFGCLSLCLSIFASFVGWLSRGALIGMVDEADCMGSTSVAAGWQIGKRRAIPLLLISILLRLPQAILAVPAMAFGLWMLLQLSDVFRSMLTGAPLAQEEMQVVFSSMMSILLPAFACLFPLVCVGGLTGWILGLLNKVSARSCVLEDLDVFASIKQGWQVMRRNVAYILLTWFALAVLGTVFGWGAAVPALIIWVPTARALLHGNWTPASIIGATVMAGYYIFVAFGIGGILTSFNSTLWTKLYKASVSRDMLDVVQDEAS